MVEQEDVAVARQRHSKRISTATNKHVTTEELLEIVFSMWSAPRLYNEDHFSHADLVYTFEHTFKCFGTQNTEIQFS
jgi:hypothetical protein